MPYGALLQRYLAEASTALSGAAPGWAVSIGRASAGMGRRLPGMRPLYNNKHRPALLPGADRPSRGAGVGCCLTVSCPAP